MKKNAQSGRQTDPQPQRASHPSLRPPGGGALLANLGGRVSELRRDGGLSRVALAEQAGLSSRFLAQVETGQGNISVTNLASLAAALGVTPGGLLGEAPLQEPDAASSAHQLRAEISALLAQAGPASLQKVRAVLRDAGEAPPAGPLVSLMGLRGAGKSTVGPVLAERLKVGFFELDDLVQEQTGLAIGEIYELHGEPYYRLAERRALQELVDAGNPAVLAVSGGIVNDPFSFQLLRDRTWLVWLRTTPALHMERVRSQGDQRPMRDRPNAMAELRNLLRVREPLYRQAAITIDTARISPQACAERLAAEISRRNSRHAAGP